MAERDLTERVDDAVLVAASRLVRLRGGTIRGALADSRVTYVENAAASAGYPDESIWRLRVDRVDALRELEDDQLRKAANAALAREGG